MACDLNVPPNVKHFKRGGRVNRHPPFFLKKVLSIFKKNKNYYDHARKKRLIVTGFNLKQQLTAMID